MVSLPCYPTVRICRCDLKVSEYASSFLCGRTARIFTALTPILQATYHQPMERVLDIYDDQGLTLIDIPLPAWVGNSPHTPVEKLASLPDDLFALILVSPDGRSATRKYACHTPTSAALSAIYLSQYYPNLSADAVHVAASNIKTACEMYGLPAFPALDKLAEASAKELAMIEAPAEGSGGQASGLSLKGVEAPAQVYLELRDRRSALVEPTDPTEPFNQLEKVLTRHCKVPGSKQADLTGTDVMPVGVVPPKTKTVKKLAAAGNTVVDGPAICQIFPERFQEMRKVAHCALGIPLDGIDEINHAIRYMEKQSAWLDPEKRVVLSQAIHARLDSMGLPVPASVSKYAAGGFRPAEDLVEAIAARQHLGTMHKVATDYSSLVMLRDQGDPQKYASHLAHLDKEHGLDIYWGSRIEDPWDATLSNEKISTVVYNKDGVFVSDTLLERLATQEREALLRILDEDLVEEFAKNPVAVFKSMPDPQKKVIGRLAMDKNWARNV